MRAFVLPAACLACCLPIVACEVEYRSGKSGGDSARAVAAADSAPRIAQRVDTVTRVDTVVRIDTVRVRDELPPFGEPPFGPPPATARAGAPPVGDSLHVTQRPDAGSPARTQGSPHANPPASPQARSEVRIPVRPTPGPPGAAAPAVTAADLSALGAAGLRVPVRGVPASRVPDTFNERRDSGSRPHQALDIVAPRGTPVLSAADGRVLKLFTSVAGGLTAYVLDPSGRFVFYYAHLDAYRPGLAEGQAVRAGDPLGTVGFTGNANAAAPHLHFAVARLDDPERWWAGTPVDPKPYLR